MDFISVRIITDNLDAMVEFYERFTGVTAHHCRRILNAIDAEPS
jgi:hypothetical protein